MSEATVAALLEALKKLSPQAPTTLVKPSFDWSLKDQYDDFQPFVKSMDSWFTLQGILEKVGELENLVHLDYVLNFLGNQGRQRYDHWQPTGSDAEAQKKSASAFLDHLQSMMDHNISICCRIYKLEETCILPGWDTQQACWSPMNPGRLLQLPDGWQEGTECVVPVGPCPRRQRVGEEATHSTHQGNNSQDVRGMQDSQCHQQQNGSLGIGSSKTVHAIHKGPQQKGQCKGHKPQQQQQRQQHSCGNCTKQHALGQASCPAKNSQCWACGKTGHWKAKCKTTKRKQAATGQCAPQQDRGTRPRQNRIHEVLTDDDPHMDEVRVAAVLNQVGTGMASALNQVGAVSLQQPTLMTRWHHYHCRREDEWNWSLCQHWDTSQYWETPTCNS